MQKEVKSHIMGFREAFSLFDQEDDGGVSQKDFMKRWHEFGFEASEEQISMLFSIGDTR